MSLENSTKMLLQKHLNGGEAFMPISNLLSEITFDKVGERPYKLPYSLYELFYHITYAQKDILEYCISEDYTTPNWPNDYWPKQQAPESEASWQQLKKDYLNDRSRLEQLIEQKSLIAVVPTGKNQTLMRELLLVIEHTAYHTGQLVIILRLLGLYK